MNLRPFHDSGLAETPCALTMAVAASRQPRTDSTGKGREIMVELLVSELAIATAWVL